MKHYVTILFVALLSFVTTQLCAENIARINARKEKNSHTQAHVRTPDLLKQWYDELEHDASPEILRSKSKTLTIILHSLAKACQQAAMVFSAPSGQKEIAALHFIGTAFETASQLAHHQADKKAQKRAAKKAAEAAQATQTATQQMQQATATIDTENETLAITKHTHTLLDYLSKEKGYAHCLEHMQHLESIDQLRSINNQQAYIDTILEEEKSSAEFLEEVFELTQLVIDNNLELVITMMQHQLHGMDLGNQLNEKEQMILMTQICDYLGHISLTQTNQDNATRSIFELSKLKDSVLKTRKALEVAMKNSLKRFVQAMHKAAKEQFVKPGKKAKHPARKK